MIAEIGTTAHLINVVQFREYYGMHLRCFEKMFQSYPIGFVLSQLKFMIPFISPLNASVALI